MKKLNLKKLDLEDPPLPESTFRQGLIVGCAIIAIPFILVLVWWVNRSLIPAITNSNLQTLETIDFSLKFDSCRRVDRLKWRQLVLNSELLHLFPLEAITHQHR
jgi:hypothetical protein